MSDLGRYRKLFTRLWLHPGFVALTDAEKVLAIFLLTGPLSNRIGLYRLSPAQASEELGTSLEGFRKRLGTVCATFGWLFDADARVLYIPSWWRWNPPSNANVMRGSLKDLGDLPPCGLMDAFTRNIETIPERFRESFLQGLQEQLPVAFRNQDQYQDQYQEQKTTKAAENKSTKAGTPTRLVPHLDTRLLTIARELLSDGPRQGVDLDYFVDAFQTTCRQKGLDVNRATAIQALAASQQGLSA